MIRGRLAAHCCRLADTESHIARAPFPAHVRAQWDAIFVIVADSAQPRAFADLPEPERWRELHCARRSRARGGVRTTTLANSRHTLAVIGYVQAGASPFERLQLAGRMLKEASARAVDTVALASPADRASGAKTRTANLEALLAATFAHAFALPSFRSAPGNEAAVTRHRSRGWGRRRSPSSHGRRPRQQSHALAHVAAAEQAGRAHVSQPDRRASPRAAHFHEASWTRPRFAASARAHSWRSRLQTKNRAPASSSCVTGRLPDESRHNVPRTSHSSARESCSTRAAST